MPPQSRHTDLDPALAAAAQDARAWPFEEARKVVKRLEKAKGGASKAGDLRDRLRPVRAAAYRHLRRGGAHGHDPARLRGADRGPRRDPAGVLLRRHGRPAEGARQRAQPGHAAGASRQAAVGHPGPVQQRVSELRRAQQRAPAPVPRPVRLRLRVPVGHRVLPRRPARRRAPQDARGLRPGDGRHPAHPGAGAPRHLLAVPAHLAHHRQGAAGADDRAPSRARAPSSTSTPTPARRSRAR